MKMKNRSHRCDIHRPRPRRGTSKPDNAKTKQKYI